MTTPQPSTNDTNNKKNEPTTQAIIFSVLGLFFALLIIPAVYLSNIPFAIIFTGPAMLLFGVLALVLWAFGLSHGIKAIRTEETRKTRAWVGALLNVFLMVSLVFSCIAGTSLLFSPTTTIFSTYYGVADFSPDGNVIAIGYRNKILLLDSKTGQKIKTLGGIKNTPDQISFSPDGKILADSSGDRLIIRDMTTYKTLETITKKDDRIRDFYFSPDGSLITIIWFEKGAEVIDTSTFEVVKTFSFGNSFKSVYLKYFIAPSHHLGRMDDAEENLSVWEMTDFIENSLTSPIISVPLPQRSDTDTTRRSFVYTFNISPDGSLLVVPFSISVDFEYNRSEFRIWNTATNELISTVEIHPITRTKPLTGTSAEYYFAFSPDSKTLAYINQQHDVILIDLTTFETKDINVEDGFNAKYFAFNHDGSQILVTDHNSLQMISVETGKIIWLYP
jgi:DNA-binding beta-propeller fold protein YncE